MYYYGRRTQRDRSGVLRRNHTHIVWTIQGAAPYDNFVSEFGVQHDVDGNGFRKKVFAERVEENPKVDKQMRAFKPSDGFED